MVGGCDCGELILRPSLKKKEKRNLIIFTLKTCSTQTTRSVLCYSVLTDLLAYVNLEKVLDSTVTSINQFSVDDVVKKLEKYSRVHLVCKRT